MSKSLLRGLRPLWLFALVAWFALSLACPASAAESDFERELIERSGADALYGGLDGETKELLSQAGVESVTDRSGAEELFGLLSGLLREKLAAPAKSLAGITLVILLCRLASGFGLLEMEDTLSLAGALACAVLVVTPLLGLLERAGRAMESAAAFLTAAVPVYGALLAASGNPAAGSAYSFWVLLAGDAIPVLAATVIFPLLRTALVLALAASASRAGLERLARSVYGFAKWLLVLLATLFSGLLSVQTAISAQADAATAKTVKLIASAAVPFVGGAFGDAAAVIQSGVQTVKAGAGAFGMLAALCIFAPPAVEAALWAGVCCLGQIVGDLFEMPRLSAALGMCLNAAKLVLAALAATGVAALVSAATVLFVKGGL